MVAVKTLFLFAIPALAGVISERQQATVLKDLQKIDSDLKALTTAANAQDGSFNQEINLQNSYSTLDNDIKSATTDANNSPAISSADSKTDIAYINNTLEPDAKAAVNAIIAKKSQLSNVKSQVCSDLQTLASDVKTYGAALIKKASSDQQSNGQAALNKINADIATGVSNFC